MTTPVSPDELPDDLEAARKAADDYLDTLHYLSRHQLPKPMLGWLAGQIAVTEHGERTLTHAATTFGPLT